MKVDFAKFKPNIKMKFPDIRTWFPKEVTARNILLFCVISLLCLGTVMVASASMPYAESIDLEKYHFFQRHLFSVFVAFVAATLCYMVSDKWIFENTVLIYVISTILLLLVLMVGMEKNGSVRWLNFGFMTFQPTEFTKVAMAIFIADYVVRRDEEVKNNFWLSIGRLTIGLGGVVFLIALEPDFGATVVISAMTLGVFFLAGAPFRQYALTALIAIGAGALAVFMSSYRLERLLNFSNPWADQYGAGYQLSNALMAYGLGDWTGVGLGQSIQKLSYLPEAHTDFMLAILGEELGFIGVCIVLILSFTMVASSMYIGYQCLKRHYLRAGYLAYGISIIFLIQIVVNAGMTLGMLPTKGLTLPFISYGGSSLLACAVMVSLLLKVDSKWRANIDEPDVELKGNRQRAK